MSGGNLPQQSDESETPAAVKTPPPQIRAPRKRRKTTAIWAFAKAVGPAITATIALIVSGLTYWDSHQADSAAALERQGSAQTLQQTYADKVSYWLTGNGDSARIVVQNQGDAPISNVVVEAATISAESRALPVGTVGFVGIGTIPPCTVITADFMKAARLSIVRYNPYYSDTGWLRIPGAWIINSLVVANRMIQSYVKADGFQLAIKYLIFTDTNNRTWFRDSLGVLSGGILDYYQPGMIMPFVNPPSMSMQYLNTSVNSALASRRADGCS